MAWTKQRAPKKILQINDPPNFQIQVANAQIEEPLATATLKIESGGKIFAEHFVVMKKSTSRIKGLRYFEEQLCSN